MRKKKAYYRELFGHYPDLVTLIQFQEMLGGIGDCFARKLVHENYVQSIFLKPNYYISKDSIISYVLSEDYTKRKLKVRV